MLFGLVVRESNWIEPSASLNFIQAPVGVRWLAETEPTI
jgi:hypothetical protein